MNPEMLKLIVDDCRMYIHHNAPKEDLDKWSKEQLAWAIDDIWKLTKLSQKASGMEQQLASKDTEIEALKAEVESLVRSIDEEMVSCHIGVFERGDDPKKAINELMAWSQGVGEYFSKDKANHYYVANTKLTEEIAALKAEIAENEVCIAALTQKYADCPHPKPLDSYGSVLECGCSYDKPSDLCCAHAPLVKALKAENTSLREQVSRLSAPVSRHNDADGILQRWFITGGRQYRYIREDATALESLLNEWLTARLEGK